MQVSFCTLEPGRAAYLPRTSSMSRSLPLQTLTILPSPGSTTRRVSPPSLSSRLEIPHVQHNLQKVPRSWKTISRAAHFANVYYLIGTTWQQRWMALRNKAQDPAPRPLCSAPNARFALSKLEGQPQPHSEREIYNSPAVISAPFCFRLLRYSRNRLILPQRIRPSI